MSTASPIRPFLAVLFLLVLATAPWAGVSAATPADPPAPDVVALTSAVRAAPEVASSRVVGGTNAPPGLDPWQVRVVAYDVKVDGWTGTHVASSAATCGGTIVEASWILTAGHCIPWSITQRYLCECAPSGGPLYRYTGYYVEYGANDIHRSAYEMAAATAIHPGYDRQTLDHDVALLQLARPLPMDRVTADHLPRTVVLARAEGDTVPPSIAGEPLRVTGWGRTSEGGAAAALLQQATVPFVPQERCQQAYAGITTITAAMLCAGDLENGGVDSCQGDSGGPLVRRYGPSVYQVGIVSFGVGCGRPGHPGVYAEVASHEPWIRSRVCATAPCPSDGDPVAATWSPRGLRVPVLLQTEDGTPLTSATGRYTVHDEWGHQLHPPTRGTYRSDSEGRTELVLPLPAWRGAHRHHIAFETATSQGTQSQWATVVPHLAPTDFQAAKMEWQHGTALLRATLISGTTPVAGGAVQVQIHNAHTDALLGTTTARTDGSGRIAMRLPTVAADQPVRVTLAYAGDLARWLQPGGHTFTQTLETVQPTLHLHGTTLQRGQATADVEALLPDGTPVRRAAVTWTLMSEDGTVRSGRAMTAQDGHALLRLGPLQAGTHRLDVSLGADPRALRGSAETTGTILLESRTPILQLRDDGYSQGMQRLRVQATLGDAPLPHQTITWTVTDATDVVAARGTARTNAQGEATVVVRHNGPGHYTLHAESAAAPADLLTAANGSLAYRLAAVNPQVQVDPIRHANGRSEIPLTVVDDAGAPLAGLRLRLTSTDETGRSHTAHAVTGRDGTAVLRIHGLAPGTHTATIETTGDARRLIVGNTSTHTLQLDAKNPHATLVDTKTWRTTTIATLRIDDQDAQPMAYERLTYTVQDAEGKTVAGGRGVTRADGAALLRLQLAPGAYTMHVDVVPNLRSLNPGATGLTVPLAVG